MTGWAIIAKNPKRIVEYDDFHFAIFSNKKEAESQRLALNAWLFGINTLYSNFISPYQVIKIIIKERQDSTTAKEEK